MDDTAKLIAVIVFAAFATERVLAAVSYLLDLAKVQRRKVLLLVLAGAIAYAVVQLVDVRVLRTLDTRSHPAVDFWLTWLVLLAGADRARELFKEAHGRTNAERRQTPAVRIHVDGGDVRGVRQLRDVG